MSSPEATQLVSHYFRFLCHARDMIVVIQDGVIRFVNRTLEGSTYTPEDLVGKPITEFKNAVPRDIEYHLARIAGGEAPVVYESRILTRDGKELPIEVSVGMTRHDDKPAVVAVIRHRLAGIG